MDRAWLERELAAGRSIESLAREAGKAASTVAYWVNKHGLVSSHAARHAARGGIDRAELETLVAEGRSIRAIAAELVMSYATVRHWLRRYGLATPRTRRLGASRAAREAGLESAVLPCPHHGATLHVRRDAHGYRCQQCRTAAVTARRRMVKVTLIAEAGGSCLLCGYDGSAAVPSPRSGRQDVRALTRRGGPIARGGSCGGREVRAAVRELPCRS